MAVASFDRAVRIFSMLFLYGQSGVLSSRLAVTFSDVSHWTVFRTPFPAGLAANDSRFV